MSNSNITYTFFLLILLISCTKDSVTKTDFYIVSPAKLVNMTGNDWNNVRNELSDKKGYWYSEFSKERNPQVKAAISLPAIDDSNSKVYCDLLLNVDRQSNHVVVVSMDTNDSLSHLNKEQAYAMMLNYNNKLLKVLTNVSPFYASYKGIDNIQHTTTIDDVLQKLNNGFEGLVLSISYDYDSHHARVSLTVYKIYNGNYVLNFDGSKG